jgi:hypothetical protein
MTAPLRTYAFSGMSQGGEVIPRVWFVAVATTEEHALTLIQDLGGAAPFNGLSLFRTETDDEIASGGYGKRSAGAWQWPCPLPFGWTLPR